MRKMNYLVGALALCLGVAVGTLGMSSLTNSNLAASFISKLRGQEKLQTVSGTVSNSASPAQQASNAAASSDNPSGINNQDSAVSSSAVSDKLKEQIVADYKQDIGIFFDAWKSPDMQTFRDKLSRAYIGNLYEKHARRAEKYLVQGIGLDVSQITFDRVEIKSAGNNTATLQADYHYTARDYSLADSTPVGEEHEQTVHAQVNLIKINSRWLITGEDTI